MLQSCLCTQNQFQTDAYINWCRQMNEPPRFHRKQWEFCYIAEALHERGLLKPGSSGLGFGVGKEPLPSLFASYGCSIVATDMDEAGAQAAGWTATHQHMGSLVAMNSRGLCEPRMFSQLVQRRVVDMTAIPPDLRNFDFTWSACSLEHVGSLELAVGFILNSVECLRPGGTAIHTTEFNMSSNQDTLETGGTVLFRRKDIEDVVRLLRSAGHDIQVSFDPGSGPADVYVDVPPYRTSPHLRLELDRFVATSIGLIVRRKSAPRAFAQSASLHRPIHKPVQKPQPLSATVSELGLRPTYLGNHRALARILDRFDLVVSTRDNSLGPHMLMEGYFDLPLTEVFLEFVRPGMTVVDVGANIGYFTLLCADLVGPNGRVHSIEADPRNFEMLEQSILINHFSGRVQARNIAALDRRGEVTIHQHPSFYGNSGLYLDEKVYPGVTSVTVPAFPIDDVLQGPVQFMKVDAELSDPLVFEGMVKTLAASPQIKIISEFAAKELQKAGHDPKRFLGRMKELGFTYSVIEEDGKLEFVTDDRLLSTDFANLFLERT